MRVVTTTLKLKAREKEQLVCVTRTTKLMDLTLSVYDCGPKAAKQAQTMDERGTQLNSVRCDIVRRIKNIFPELDNERLEFQKKRKKAISLKHRFCF